jgi:hypothetical protein
MSEDEARRAANEEAGDEVELHGHGKLKAANDEESRKSEFPEGGDEVEAHGFRREQPRKA